MQFALGLLLASTAVTTAQAGPDFLAQAADAVAAGKTTAALELVDQAIAKEPRNPNAYLLRGSILEARERYKDALVDFTRVAELEPKNSAIYQRRGVVQFKLGNIDASIRDFDRYITLRPEAKVSHWQRGIAYFYAGRFEDGRRQFEGYQDFDRNDIENALWRFMCMARKDGLAQARKDILKIGDDRRVPMRQIYELFKGDIEPDAVLAATRAGAPTMDELNARLFYAYLYLGIYEDLLGNRPQALAHLNRAVEHRIGHYMWDVARVHRDLLKTQAAR